MSGEVLILSLLYILYIYKKWSYFNDVVMSLDNLKINNK